MESKIKNTEGSLIKRLEQDFKASWDFVSRSISDSLPNSLEIQIMYLNNLVNTDIIDGDILKPIALNMSKILSYRDLENIIKNGLVYHTEFVKCTEVEEIKNKIFDGNFVICMPCVAYAFDVKSFEKRSIGDASTEASVKGSRDSFIEVIGTNVSLVRRRIKTSDLKTEMFEVGTEAKTKVCLIYMESIADEKLLNNIRQRLNAIDIPCITSPSIFEENICDRPHSIFPQIQYTERPDKFCACITEGKAGIIVDSLPIGYIAPAMFNMLMQDPEEYTISPTMANVKRALRYVDMILSLTLSAFYVAVTTFHSEMLPTKLLNSIVRSKQSVPFHAYTEVIIMLIAFEMILEAGARLPKNIGQTISIIGGLIIGDAAVAAKLVSPVVVVIVAIVGATGFIIPNQDLTNAIRICRFILVILSAIAGFFGLSFGIIIILLYLSSFESFGCPYMKPYVAGKYSQMFKDTIIRGRLTKKKKVWW